MYIIQTIHINICRSLKIALVRLIHCTLPNNTKSQGNQVNLHHIESRPSKRNNSDVEFFVSCDNKTGRLKESLDAVKKISKNFRLMSRETSEETGLFVFFIFPHVYLRSLILIIIVKLRIRIHVPEQSKQKLSRPYYI